MGTDVVNIGTTDVVNIGTRTPHSPAEERYRADAHRYAEQATRARGAHARRLQSLEDVFGPAVRAAAEEHLERFTESSGEAVFSLERVVALGDEDREQVREELAHVRALLTNAEAEVERARALPEEIVERAERYFSATRRARPVWLKDAIAELEAIEILKTEEPF